MKNLPCYYLYIIIFLLTNADCFAQVSNPCGVVASISPASADSVVPSGTIISFTSTSTNATSFTWLYDGTYLGSSSTLLNYQITTGTHRLSLVASNGTCSDTTTVVYFAAGTPHNLDSIMIANYGSYDNNEEATCVDKTPDGGLVIGGVRYLSTSCGEAGIIVKLRDRGCIDWSKQFLSPYYCNSKITNTYAGADSTFYAVNNANELTKLDRNGNILWTKKYLLGILYITGDPQGKVYILSGYNGNGLSVTKLNSDGSVIWNKVLRLSNKDWNGSTEYQLSSPTGIVWTKDKLYISGTVISATTAYSYLTRVDALTGTKDWQYGYTDPGNPGAIWFTHLALYDTLLMASSGDNGQTVTLIDPQGIVRKNIKTQFASSYSAKVTRAGTDSKGHIYMMQWTKKTLPLQPYYWYATNFAEIDTSLNKYWGMVYANSSRGYFADATMGKDNKFAAVGEEFGYVDDALYGSSDMRLLKVDTVSSNASCYGQDNFSIALKPVNRVDFEFLVDSSLVIVSEAGTPFTVKDTYIQSRYSCPDFLDSCNFMRISGPVNLCSYNDIYTYRLHRNKKCVLLPQWNLPSGVAITAQTDSTISLKFSGFGVYNVAAVLQSCMPIKDSLVISIVSRSRPLNIGADTSICPGSTIMLHAANNFFSYKWSDGSIDSLLNVTQPGTYWVETIDSCNNHQRDSIIVGAYNNIINIGPDRMSCANDTLHLNAPTGFINYQWSNDYRINSTNTQNVIVSPAIDTAYYLKAEKLPGCFAYDTVRIKVNSAPVIQLGADTSLCHGDKLVLNAGSNFDKYLWNNGTTMPQLTVFATGSYAVIGTTGMGCRSYDTIRIMNIWPNPVINLDKNAGLCINTTRTLSPGNYVSYLWQDGSILPTFIAKAPGTYFVSVKDSHQCQGTDTVHILRMLDSPVDFLPADTAVCTYGEVTIKVKQPFKSYLWSNGTNGPSILIKQPGIYSLMVTDTNNCVGTDSVIVNPKQCMEGVYVPTAFSPNGDGINDVFKILVFGNLHEFECTVFNRYGQVVFSSKDPLHGWDGNFKGLKQDFGTYTWICRYRLNGDPVQVKKGYIVLIR